MSDSARPATAAVLTLGCKLNIADSEAIARRLRDAGWRLTDRASKDVDAVVINTCSVEETTVPRIRMSSVQPQDLSSALIDLWQNKRLCRHFHLALQSGSVATLQRMRRRYSQDEFRQAVRQLREAVPGIAITTDVIVGFPGETDAEFEESYDFCREMAFAAIHVFPYSQRSGTVAFKLPDQVDDSTKKARVRRLVELSKQMSTEYRQCYVEQSVAVLWETQHEGIWEGLTDTYARVRVASIEDLKNRITNVRITALSEDGLEGEIEA